MAVEPLSVQIHTLMKALEAVSPEKAADLVFKGKVLDWVRDLPPASRPPELYRAVCRAFGMEEESLRRTLDPTAKRVDFDALVPATGWLRDYVEYTRTTEPPTVFHFMVGAVTIATALARNVYFTRGAQEIYPNLTVVLVAPSGKCRKTSACQIGTGLLQRIGANVLADKLTPEALVEAFKERTSATGLIYAPELAVFLGKQKYQEGMVPMLTALFDSPSTWRSATIMRGDSELKNVGLTMLGASTLDWIQTAIPKEAFGGGFMSRILFVVQEDTPRSFPLPPPMDDTKKASLLERLKKMTHYRGQFRLSADAREWYVRWYHTKNDRGTDNRHYAGYFERKPDHLLRLAQVLAISEEGDRLVLDLSHLQGALRILDWVEQYLPSTFDQMQESGAGVTQGAIIQQLKKSNGAEQHSVLLRKNHRKMNALQFRQYIDTLRSAGLIEYDGNTRTYYLTKEGWNT